MNDDDPTLAALSSAVDSIESRYLTCGQFSMPAPLQITASGGQTATFPIKRGEQLTELKKLTEVAATEGWISSVSDGSVARDGSARGHHEHVQVRADVPGDRLQPLCPRGGGAPG